MKVDIMYDFFVCEEAQRFFKDLTDYEIAEHNKRSIVRSVKQRSISSQCSQSLCSLRPPLIAYSARPPPASSGT